ncbi:tRNA threonylcarbamoyladenosine dehydratase [Eubacteriaceae bacterium ES3]|nr:tRNA threonylcarbamoyladenosine dehydratase [Eubacteriaceae bacterium ES3]
MQPGENIFDRTKKIIGQDGLDKLKNARVILFGVGGVGSFVAEGLIRSGVGSLTLVDKDVVDPSNLNRQIMATQDTIGQVKVEVMAKRLLSINPAAVINPVHRCYTEECVHLFDLSGYDYVVDAIDMVSAKISLIVEAKKAEVPIISCMGTGNKLDPSRFEIVDLYKTSVCPLAKVMRRELRQREIKSLKVLFSTEEPVIRETPPGSIAFVPSVAGLMIAGQVVRDLLQKEV